jgi:hypothetical protein
LIFPRNFRIHLIQEFSGFDFSKNFLDLIFPCVFILLFSDLETYNNSFFHLIYTKFISFNTMASTSPANYNHDLYVLLQALACRNTLSTQYDEGFLERTVEMVTGYAFGTLGKDTFARTLLKALKEVILHAKVKRDNAVLIETIIGRPFVRSGPDDPNNESEDRAILAEGLRRFAALVHVDTAKILEFFRSHGEQEIEIPLIEFHGFASVTVHRPNDSDKYAIDFDHNLRTLALVLAEQFVERSDMRYKECERMYRWFVDQSDREMPQQMKKRTFDDLFKWVSQEMLVAGNEVKMAGKVRAIMLEGTKVHRQSSYISCFGRHTVPTIEAEAEHRAILYEAVHRFGEAIKADLPEIEDFFERRSIGVTNDGWASCEEASGAEASCGGASCGGASSGGASSEDVSGDDVKRKRSILDLAEGVCEWDQDAPRSTPKAKHTHVAEGSELPLYLRGLAPLQLLEASPVNGASPTYEQTSPAYSPKATAFSRMHISAPSFPLERSDAQVTPRAPFVGDADEITPDNPAFWAPSSPAYSGQTP